MSPLESEPALAALVAYAREGPDAVIEIDDTIVSERVLTACRDREDED